MLNLNFYDMTISKATEETLKKFKKRVEREISFYPGVSLHFHINQKSRKIQHIYMSLNYGQQKLFEQEFLSKNWESALEQCVQDALHAIRRDPSLMRKTPTNYNVY